MTSSPGLFDLPPTVRRNIYCEAGLIVDEELALHHEERAERRQNGRSVPDLGPSIALMLISRAIHTEVSRLLYSSNTFFIQYKAPSGSVRARDLGPLRRLSQAALSMLTFLDVRLHVSARTRGAHKPGGILSSGRKPECPDSADEPLSSASPRDQAALVEWQATVRHCSRYIRPNTLHLSLICDVADLKMARCITTPLNQFPVLASCHLRLGNDPNTGLCHIARAAAMRALGRGPDCLEPSSVFFFSPFRFLDLPQELRLHILEYTDLVTPLSQVSWTPGEGYKAIMWLPCYGPCRPPYDGCHPSAHRRCKANHFACQFRDCWRRDRDCFCSRYHAAYSPQCNCWLPPTPLFLVSRSFYADAQATFFSRNRFTINHTPPPPSWDPWVSPEPRPERHSGSIFLTDAVPPSALRHLRSLEFHSLPIASYPVAGDAADQDWIRTIDYMKDKIDPRSVVINIYINEFLDGSHMGFFDALAEDGGIDLLKAFLGSLWPLEMSDSRAVQEIYMLLNLGEANVGYYIRRRHPVWPPEIEPGSGCEIIRSERECRVVGYQSRPEAQNNSDMVEGIWGNVYTTY